MRGLGAVDRRWAQLAYQFGHEFGHVICNSWTSAAAHPLGLSHWLEEGLVEAFAIYMLARMGARWGDDPPYKAWSSYGASLTSYSNDLLTKYGSRSIAETFYADPKSWFRRLEPKLTEAVTLTSDIHPVIPMIARALLDEPSLVADMKALNRWAEHGALPIDQYLQRWANSCQEIGAQGEMPLRIAKALGTTIASQKDAL